MALLFSRAGMEDIEIEPLPGTLKVGGGHSDASGALAPPLRSALAADGSCEVLLDADGLTVAKALGLASPAGAGAATISGDSASYGALVSVSIGGQEGIFSASIKWHGSAQPL